MGKVWTLVLLLCCVAVRGEDWQAVMDYLEQLAVNRSSSCEDALAAIKAGPLGLNEVQQACKLSQAEMDHVAQLIHDQDHQLLAQKIRTSLMLQQRQTATTSADISAFAAALDDKDGTSAPSSKAPTPKPTTSAPVASRAPTTASLKCKIFDPFYVDGVEVPSHVDFFHPFSLKDKSGTSRTNVYNLAFAASVLNFGLQQIVAHTGLPEELSLGVNILINAVYALLLLRAKVNKVSNCYTSVGLGMYDVAARGVYTPECEANMDLDPTKSYAMFYVSLPKSTVATCGPESATCNSASDFAIMCVAVSLCPQHYAVYLNEGTMGCIGNVKLSPFGAGVDLRVAYSPVDNVITTDFTLFDFTKSKTQTFTEVSFNMDITMNIPVPLDSGLGIVDISGSITVAMGGDVLTSPPQSAFKDLMTGSSNNIMLVQGESSVRILLDRVTVGLLPRLTIPLKQINILVNGKDRTSNSVVLKQGLHFYYGPAVTSSSSMITFLDNLFARLKAVVGSALDFIGGDAFKGLKIGAKIMDKILSNVQSLSQLGQPTIGLFWNFATTMSFALYQYLNLDFEVLAIKGDFGLSCTLQDGMSCKILLPNFSGLFNDMVNFVKDGAGYLLKKADQIIGACLDDIADGVDKFTKRTYQLASQAVKSGKKIMSTLAKDAKALAAGISACGDEIVEVAKECKFDVSFPSLSGIDNPLNWPSMVSKFAGVTGKVDDLAKDLGNCIVNLAKTTGSVAGTLGEGYGSCIVPSSAGECTKSVCVPFVGWDGNNCCCARVAGYCIKRSDACCGLKWSSCQWNVCLWKKLKFKCTVPKTCSG